LEKILKKIEALNQRTDQESAKTGKKKVVKTVLSEKNK
jgi:hypothetical protein